MQGMVDIVQQKLKLQPCYGHWFQEMWRTSGWTFSDGTCTATKAWRAPTWSWASIEHKDGFITISQVAWNTDDNELSADCLAIKGSTSSNDALTLESWKDYPDGTLWIWAYACGATLHALCEECKQAGEPAFTIPALSDFEIKQLNTPLREEESYRTDQDDIEVICVILGGGRENLELLICSERADGEPP